MHTDFALPLDFLPVLFLLLHSRCCCCSSWIHHLRWGAVLVSVVLTVGEQT